MDKKIIFIYLQGHILHIICLMHFTHVKLTKDKDLFKIYY